MVECSKHDYSVAFCHKVLCYRHQGIHSLLLKINCRLYGFPLSLISALYRKVFYTDPQARQFFELLCIYAERFSAMIPITFLTGFYVTQVVNRWWDQFMSLPWPDKLALKLVSYCPGTVSPT